MTIEEIKCSIESYMQAKGLVFNGPAQLRYMVEVNDQIVSVCPTGCLALIHGIKSKPEFIDKLWTRELTNLIGIPYENLQHLSNGFEGFDSLSPNDNEYYVLGTYFRTLRV